MKILVNQKQYRKARDWDRNGNGVNKNEDIMKVKRVTFFTNEDIFHSIDVL